MAEVMYFNPTWRASFFTKTDAADPAMRILLTARSEDEAAYKALAMLRDEYERVDLVRTIDKSHNIPMGEFRILG